MDDDAEIRGWKRYPARPHHRARPQPLTRDQQDNQNVQVRLRPLPKDSQFSCRMSFHNLLPEELGALVWAITWGGDGKLVHGLGMGKPFGFGQVKIVLSNPELFPNRAEASPPTLGQCRVRFEASIDEAYRSAQSNAAGGQQSWRDSEQIEQLLAMANPDRISEFPGRLRYMRLQQRSRINDFVDAKRENNRRVLPEYIRYQGIPDNDLFPRNRQRLDITSPKSSDAGGDVTRESARGADRAAIEWLDRSIADLAKANANAHRNHVLRSKGLAEKWRKLEPRELQRAVLEEIKRRWLRDCNTEWKEEAISGRSAKRAFSLYNEAV